MTGGVHVKDFVRQMAIYSLGEGKICLDRRKQVSQPNNEPNNQRKNQTANQPAKEVTKAQDLEQVVIS
jgi:hypothetical protein